MAWRNQQHSNSVAGVSRYASTNRALHYSLDETIETPPGREIKQSRQCGSTGLDTMISLRGGIRKTPISPVRGSRYSPEAEEFVMTEGDELEDSTTPEYSYAPPPQRYVQPNPPTSPDVVYCSEVQTDTGSMIKSIHEDNRRLTNENNALQNDISSLKGKLHEKAVLCEALRGKVKELAVREKDQREEYEARLRLQQPQQSTIQDVTGLEQDNARLELLCEERSDEIDRLKSEKERTDERVAELQRVVDGLAEGIAEIKEVGIHDQDLQAELNELREQKNEVEDVLTQQLHSLSNEYEKLSDSCRDWQRRYRELQSSMTMFGGDDDLTYASQQHQIFEHLATAISDSNWLHQVVESAAIGTVDLELRAGNTEPDSERLERISGKSLLDTSIMNGAYVKKLRNAILGTIANREDGGGCDIQ
eukprot:TRINITY_DN10559_c0_g1_i1.p1 TRINITY_DN10559_c0_g1~~TRINITY_DN10559_c0_g1_i1.p1  ORF type:complete len:420 (+),score=121.20 TRINITY_DN10559_c0_g1_i1:58-1317(+)